MKHQQTPLKPRPASRRRRRLLAAGLGLLACAWLASAAPAQLNEPADKLPVVFEGVGVTERLGDYVPLGLEFTNERGESVPLRSYYGGNRPVLLTLVYYSCPSLCNQVMQGMLTGLKEVDFSIGKEFDVISISISPAETSEMARGREQGYCEIYGRVGAAEGWHFHTGTAENIKALADAVGFGFRYDEKTKQYAHGSTLIFTAPDGQIIRYLGGVTFPPKDLRMALLESAEGRIGTPFDHLFFFCFHFDPKTGTYTPAILNITRVVGALTVIFIALFILSLLVWEKRFRRAARRPDVSDLHHQTQVVASTPAVSLAGVVSGEGEGTTS